MRLPLVLSLLSFVMVSSSQAAEIDRTPIKLSDGIRDKALGILHKGLASDEFWPSMHAAEALTMAGQGKEVIAHCGALLPNEKDDQRRCGLAREMVRAGDLTKTAVLIEILAKEDPHGHTHAAESLYKVGETGNGDLLRRAMDKGATPSLRLMAAGALAKAGNPAALAAIRKESASEDGPTYQIAGWLLARLGDESDIPQLQKNVARATDPLVKAYCEHALATLGDAGGRAALTSNLTNADPGMRVYAADFAADAWMTSAQDTLEKLLDDDVLDVRVRAAHALLFCSQAAPLPRSAEIVKDVYVASKENPRNTEGSIIRLADGRLLFANSEFAGGTSDFAGARITACTSADGGKTWSKQRVLQENTGKMNVMSVTLRRLEQDELPIGPIGLFFLETNSFHDLKVFLRVSTDEGETFGERIAVSTEPGYHVLNNDRVARLRSGRLLVPVASTKDVEKENHFVCTCIYSDDAGKTWKHGQGKFDQPGRGAMEPDVIELRDGRVLMIARTQQGIIAAAHSEDGGETWGKPFALSVKAPEAPATIRRIPATGDLLLIWNNTYKAGTGHGGRRTPLTAAISSDEGETWTHVKNLESRNDQTYSYISLFFPAGRAVTSYWVEEAGQYSLRFRSLPVGWFYQD